MCRKTLTSPELGFKVPRSLAALFCVDAFAGGLVVHSLRALWLFQRFDVSLAAAGQFFFWAGLLTAGSQLAARCSPPAGSRRR